MFKYCIYSSNNNANLVGTVINKRGNWEQIERDEDNKEEIFTTCNFIWKPTNLSTAGYNKLDHCARSRPKDVFQVFNHFENLYGLCTKTGLVRSLRKYYSSTKEAKQVKYVVYDSTPTSYLVSPNLTEYEYSLFAGRFQEIAKQDFSREALPQKHCAKNFWLVKPADQNQGRGIEVFKNLHEIEEFLTSKTTQSFWVIQKYLERPLLYHGRKFDIRMWAFVTAKNEVFLYRKGYLRTSSEEFDLKNSNNYVHLTNNCLQKHGGNYGQHEEGNTLPLEALDAYFAENYPDLKPTVEAHIMPRIRDLVIDSILATKQGLNPMNRKNAFEFLGYDFMIDEDLRTWLIEANTNPYIGVPTEYIGGLLNVMLDDLLKIVVDPLFPPQETADPTRPNDFELLYCENGSAHHNGPLNLRTPFKKNVYPIEELVPADVTKKLLILERGPEPVQPKLKESKSVKVLKEKGRENKIRELKAKEKVEGLEEGKEEERAESKLRNLMKGVEQSKEGKLKDDRIVQQIREKVRRRNKTPNLERGYSEEMNMNRISQLNQSKERFVNEKDEAKTVENIEQDSKEIKDGNHLPFINEVIDVMKEKDMERTAEKMRTKGGNKTKSLKLPHRGPSFAQSSRKGDVHQKQAAQETQNPQDYNLEVEMLNYLGVEGTEIKTFREQDNPVPLGQVTVERTKIEETSKKLDVEELHKDLHLALIYKTNHNSMSYTKKVASVLECLSECELLTERQSQTACRILNFIAQSDARGLLTQQFAVDALMKVLTSSNTRQSMKCHIVDIFYMLAKVPGLKAQLLDTTLVSTISRMSLSDLTRPENFTQNEQLLLLMLYCLLTIGKIFNRRAFTSGAFAELQSARYSFICQGGILAAWLIIHKVSDSEMRAFVYKSLFDHVLLEDLEQQAILMKQLSQNSNAKSVESLDRIPDDHRISTMLPGLNSQREPGEKSSRDLGDTSKVLDEEESKKKLEKNGVDKATHLFKLFAEAYQKDLLIEELDEYIALRKDGQFGFEEEDRERRKQVGENGKKEEEDVQQREESEEGKQKKSIVDRIEKRVENNLQRYQLEVNCRQKEIKDILKEKELEDKKRQARSQLQQKAEAMRRRNRLEIKKKELQKLAYKANIDEKPDQLKPIELGPFEINIQKASWAVIKNYDGQKGEEPSPLKGYAGAMLGETSSRPRGKQVAGEVSAIGLKGNDKGYNIQTDNNTWGRETGSLKQLGGGMLAIDSRRGSKQKIDESPLKRISPWKSAKGVLNDFLQAPNKVSLSPKSKKVKSNLTDLHTFSRHYPIDAINSHATDDIEEKMESPEKTYRASQLPKESPKLPPVVPSPGTNPGAVCFDDKAAKTNGLKSFSMLFEIKKQNLPKGKITVAKDAYRFFNSNEFSLKKVPI